MDGIIFVVFGDNDPDFSVLGGGDSYVIFGIAHVRGGGFGWLVCFINIFVQAHFTMLTGSLLLTNDNIVFNRASDSDRVGIDYNAAGRTLIIYIENRHTYKIKGRGKIHKKILVSKYLWGAIRWYFIFCHFCPSYRNFSRTFDISRRGFQDFL